MKYSCIVPIYNESKTIGNVLKVISETSEITEIICVDDGSKDNSSQIIENLFPKITLIKHRKNFGKSEAIMSGLSKAKYPNIILIDGDLIGLTVSDLKKSIMLFEDNKLDSLVINKGPLDAFDAFAKKLFRFLFSIQGERIIKKQYLEYVLRASNVSGYQLEVAQNKFLIEHNKKVAYTDISAKGIYKSQKGDFIRGTINEFKMWKDVVSYAGLIFFIKQSLVFSREKL